MNLTSTTHSDKIVNIIFDAILSGRLNPGVKLTENSLQQEFGFSRSVVREGFIKLVNAGILIHKPNQGVRVTLPDQAQINQIYQTRQIIETGVIRLLVEKHLNNQLDIAAIEAFVTREEQLYNSKQRGKLTRKSCDFHLSLAELCQNLYLVAALKPLIPLSALAAAIYAQQNSSFCSFVEHRLLVDAIKTKNTELAVTTITNHLKHCVSVLDFKLPVKQKTNYSNIYLAD